MIYFQSQNKIKVSATEARLFWLSLIICQIIWIIFIFGTIFKLDLKWFVSIQCTLLHVVMLGSYCYDISHKQLTNPWWWSTFSVILGLGTRWYKPIRLYAICWALILWGHDIHISVDMICHDFIALLIRIPYVPIRLSR